MRKVDVGRRARPQFRNARPLALCFLLAAACGGESGRARRSDARVASVEVVPLEGIEAALRARRGKGILLTFWATWCAPCVAELPHLAEAAGAFADRGGVLLGVSYDLFVEGASAAEVPGAIRGFLARKRLAFDVLVYDAPDHDAINARFALPGEIPVTLAIDRLGEIVDRQEGAGSRARFEEMIRRALGE